MEIYVRDLETRPSARPRRADLSAEGRAALRVLPWVMLGNGSKSQGSANPVRIGPHETSLAEIVGEMRG